LIHLDTSFLIRALVRDSGEDRLLREWLQSQTPIAISAISWTEFLSGPAEARHVALAHHVVGEPVAFAGDDANLAARLFNVGGRRRGSLVDCMIAAIALRAGATLATANPVDFRRLEPVGLKVVGVKGTP
jgi:predicted nucleic acid-binding protein